MILSTANINSQQDWLLKLEIDYKKEVIVTCNCKTKLGTSHIVIITSFEDILFYKEVYGEDDDIELEILSIEC